MFSNLSFIFLNCNDNDNKSIVIHTFIRNSYFIILHLKLSSLFYSTQLIDLFIYDSPLSPSPNLQKNQQSSLQIPNKNFATVVYNFHHIYHHTRIFLFLSSDEKSINFYNSSADLFLNAN